MKFKFEEQIEKFISTHSKSVLIENLFYTSSDHIFTGVTQLWLYNDSSQEFFFGRDHQRKQIEENEFIAQSLYLFYGRNISYLFVDELPHDHQSSPLDNVSTFGKGNDKKESSLDSDQEEPFQRSKPNDPKSLFNKECETTILSGKAMQLKHSGLNIFQVVLAKLSSSDLLDLQKKSSLKSETQMISFSFRYPSHPDSNSTCRDINKILVLLCGQDSNFAKKDSLVMAQLDRQIGYNFLKNVKLDIKDGIFQVFESQQINQVFLLSTTGDFFSFDFVSDTLECIGENPNEVKGSVKSSEFFHHANRIAVSLDNGNFLVYHLYYKELLDMTVLQCPLNTSNQAICDFKQNQKLQETINQTNDLVLSNDHVDNSESKYIIISMSRRDFNSLCFDFK